MNGDKRKRAVGRSSSTNSSTNSSVMFPFFNMYSTKAEQILSRYRPIAPKPPKQDPNQQSQSSQQQQGPDSSTPQTAAAAAATTTNNTITQQSSSTSVGCRKGGRKRSGDSLVSPRSYKRSPSNRKQEPNKTHPPQPQPQPQQQQQQQQMVPVVMEMGCSLSSITTSVSMASPNLSPNVMPQQQNPWEAAQAQAQAAAQAQVQVHQATTAAQAQAAQAAQAAQPGAMNPNLVLEDASSSVMLAKNLINMGGGWKNSGSCSGSYEMFIRAGNNNSSSCSNNSRSLVSDLASPNGFVYSSSNNVQISPSSSHPPHPLQHHPHHPPHPHPLLLHPSSAMPNQLAAVPAPPAANLPPHPAAVHRIQSQQEDQERGNRQQDQNGDEQQDRSNKNQEQAEEDDDDTPKLVTLSLLPDTPSHPSESASASAAATTTTTAGLRFRDAPQQPLELSLLPPRHAAEPPRYAAVPPAAPEQQVPDVARIELGSPSSKSNTNSSSRKVIDCGYLEQAYGGSSDPVVLTDDGNLARSVVLWSNLSYNKVMSERLSGKPQRAAGPYIDPLGLPTQLGCYRYRSPIGSECDAVLWGFLKKFMLLDHQHQHHQRHHFVSSSSHTSVPEVVEQNSVQNYHHHHHQAHPHPHAHTFQQHQQHVINMMNQNSQPPQQQQHQPQQQQQRVITPQPIRPIRMGVGSSTVYLESITEADYYSGLLSGSLESVESQLEKGGVPALVTDRSNRVRWVNGAYNQLVGSSPAAAAASSPPALPSSASSNICCKLDQQESANSTSSSVQGGGGGGGGGLGGAGSSPATRQHQQQPDVFFMFQCGSSSASSGSSSERSPYSAVRLSGQARVEWMDCGKRCLLTGIPCEMRRLDDEHLGSLFVWKLNLNVATVRHNHITNFVGAPNAHHHQLAATPYCRS